MPPVFNSILFNFIIADCNAIDPAITTNISNNGHTLIIYNISEDAMIKLVFPTNNDSNNNKLTLVDVGVSLASNPTLRLTVPGLAQQLVYAFNYTDLKAYRNNEVLHAPFAKIPSGYVTGETPTLTAPQLTDVLTGVTNFTKPTYGREKLFTLRFTNCSDPKGYPCGSGICISPDGTCPSNYTPSTQPGSSCCEVNN
jgi:hypothetical protein